MASFKYAFLLVAFFVADSLASEYQPCAGKPVPKNVVISGCNTLPCQFKRGTDVEAKIDFEVVQDTATLRPEVDVEIDKIHVKYPLPQQNACKDLDNTDCPLEKGELATYKLKMPIERAYPKIALTIEMSLVDQSKQSQVCIRIPAVVVD